MPSLFSTQFTFLLFLTTAPAHEEFARGGGVKIIALGARMHGRDLQIGEIAEAITRSQPNSEAAKGYFLEFATGRAVQQISFTHHPTRVE